ncbi:MAG TPA: MoaD/ThiS family protein [Dissulfurispiraceae bacterium]|nr:MoaD/ThiS family protein [Dissulfurispiraceae bacterium]
MSVKVIIPSFLQTITCGDTEADAPAGNVNDIIRGLDRLYPGFEDKITGDGGIKEFINIYVNDENIRFLQGELTQARDGDEISIIPVIAGGSSNAFSGE